MPLLKYNSQYFRDPEATAKAFRGGEFDFYHILHKLIFWSTGSFNTGDLAVIHPDGAVAIVDRSKDIIISGGEVSPLFKCLCGYFSNRPRRMLRVLR